jgi:outer membrane protein, heavy metal efflux system
MASIRYPIVFVLLVLCGCRTASVARSIHVADPDVFRSGTDSSRSPEDSNPVVVTTSERQSEADSATIQPVSAESPNSSEAVADEGREVHMGERLQLLGAVSLALAQNPDLVALRQTEGVGAAAYGVASTYPFNPFVQVQATPYQELPGSGSGTTAHYVLLMQRIQLAHQQQHREDAAQSSLNSIRWNIHHAELQAASLTAQLYFTVLYQRGLLEVAQASQSNNQQLLEAINKRFEGGDAAAADVATVRVDTRSTQQQLRLAEANYQTALRNLRRHLGVPIDSPQEYTGDIRQIRWQLPAPATNGSEWVRGTDPSSSTDKAWLATWAATRPDVLAAHANIDVARANWRLASADRVPDVQTGPYYARGPDGGTFVGLRAEMNLPIINSGKPLENQRAAEFGQRSTIWQQSQVRAELEAQAAFERYELAYHALAQESTDDPEALPQELQSLERQFRAGEVDVVRVIQARTSILQNQRARLDLLNELAQSAALLVGATGMPIEMLIVDVHAVRRE